MLCRLLILVFAAVAALVAQRADAYAGRIIDAVTRAPIAGAFVTLHETVVRTDRNGFFEVGGAAGAIGVRAYGYWRDEIAAERLAGGAQEIPLVPFRPKALYLSYYGVSNKTLRQATLALLEKTELNALVIDVKGDRGLIAFKTEVPLAVQVGAAKSTIPDIKGLIGTLRQAGIYTIARIVVFKDQPLASARPDLAVRTASGALWRDRERLAWTDPFYQEVWDYNIAIAVEAARNGFDEIQFDYVRFPDAKGLRFALPNTERNRRQAIVGFLAEARKRLVPYNVFLSADIFGYVCWNLNDTLIGQQLEDLDPVLDYISPMLYPSGFQFGIPGYRNPVANSYQIVYLSLRRAAERTGLPAVRFRPWLQAFRDYAFDRRPFGGREIRNQIEAAERFGADGWMLWNPRNLYSADGLG